VLQRPAVIERISSDSLAGVGGNRRLTQGRSRERASAQPGSCALELPSLTAGAAWQAQSGMGQHALVVAHAIPRSQDNSLLPAARFPGGEGCGDAPAREDRGGKRGRESMPGPQIEPLSNGALHRSYPTVLGAGLGRVGRGWRCSSEMEPGAEQGSGTIEFIHGGRSAKEPR
jgi:hypothetical protein